MEYTPGQVWSILVTGSEDVDEQIDLDMALSTMPRQDQEFLRLLASGYSVGAAMRGAGLRGNQTRYKRYVLTRLTKVLNGEEEEDE